MTDGGRAPRTPTGSQAPISEPVTNATFAMILGPEVIEPVVQIPAETPSREIREIEIFDPRSGEPTPGAVQVWLSEPAHGELEATLLGLHRAAVPGIVLGHRPTPDTIAGLRRIVETTGVVCWYKPAKTPWLQLLDESRRVVEATQSVSTQRDGGISLGDLPRLADALADLLGGAILIEDDRFSVLGYSTDAVGYDPGRDAAILGRQMPGEWLEYLNSEGILDILRNSDDAVELSSGPFTERRRLITAIRVDRQFRGVMWLAEGDTPLPADAAERLRSASRTAAPHLRRHLELGRAERTARARRVRALLSGEDVGRPEIEELGLTGEAEVALIAVRRSTSESLDEQQGEQLQNAIYLACQATQMHCAVTAIGGAVFCIFSTTADGMRTHSTVLAETLLRSCSQAVRSELHLALTESTDNFGELPRLRSQADLILEALARHAPGSSQIMSFPAAAPTVLLDRFAESTASMGGLVRYDKIERIHEYDSINGSEYARTLAGYLAENSNSVRSARGLNIHPTTLRYRLRRLTQLFGIDFENADERLLCALLLRSDVRISPQSS